jgi:esterase/lipase
VQSKSIRPQFKTKTVQGSDIIDVAEQFFVESLEEWRKVHQLDKITLAGHSLGGYLSLAYAEKYPQHIDRLILLSPAGIPNDDGSKMKKRMKEMFEYWSEYQHHVIVTGLKPNTKYYYKCIVELDDGRQVDIENHLSTMNDVDDTDDDYYNKKSDFHQDTDEFEYNIVITQIEFLVVIIVTRMMTRMMKMNSYSVSKLHQHQKINIAEPNLQSLL